MIGKDIIEARDHGLKLAAEKGYAYINGYDHPQILAGQGTLALEVKCLSFEFEICVTSIL